MANHHQPQPERLIVPCTFKAAEGSDPDLIEGYASVFGNVDSYGDVVQPGAFTKTLKERIPRGLVKIFDSHEWSVRATLGTWIDGHEDSKGLFLRGRLSQAQDVQNARTKMREGHIDRLSIGYQTIRESYEKREGGAVRLLEEVKLFEASPVPIAANEEAVITLAKSGALPFQALALADADRAWDAAAAETRVRAWAAKGGAMNWALYRRAFAWWDRKAPTEFASHQLLIADVVGDQLKAIPRAVIAAGLGVLALPAIEQAAVQQHLGAYFEEIGETAPWDRKGILEIALAKSRSGAQDLVVERAEIARLAGALDPDTKAHLLAMLAGPPAAPLTPKNDAEPETKAPTGKDQDVDLRLRAAAMSL